MNLSANFPSTNHAVSHDENKHVISNSGNNHTITVSGNSHANTVSGTNHAIINDESNRPPLLMTPGPTQVRENVRHARSLECTNPDLDNSFVEFYRETCQMISSMLDTRNETFILSGEGILGLEAACASLTEPGDDVLVISNGIYGEGFADFVKMYGGIPYLYTANDLETIDIDALSGFLKDNHSFKYATVVHGDTPSGMLNHVEKICPLLKQYGILTVVDSVSTMFGEELHVDEAQIDILCGGSQKVISAPPGLTLLTVSEDAKLSIRARKVPVASFYANIAAFEGYYEAKWFPYTMPVSDIYGLRSAIENIQSDPGILTRHAAIAKATRAALTKAGLHLHLKSGHSNTVSVFDVPKGVTDQQILHTMMEEHNIMLAGSFGALSGKVIRIGHMGENATVDNMLATMRALDDTFSKLNVPLQSSLETTFLNNIKGL